MARIASEAKAGYYPIHKHAISLLATHLRAAETIDGKPGLLVGSPGDPTAQPTFSKVSKTLNILDPCAGEGAAVQQLAGLLGVSEDHVYCVELDAGRTEKIKERMPKCNLLGPATFIGGVMITGYTFGLAYVNPPYSDEFGGGKREEQTFFDKAMRLLDYNGVMVLVCPFKAFVGNRSFVESVDCQLQDTVVFKLPDEIRNYNEIMVIGKKRRHELVRDSVYEHGILSKAQFQWNGYITMDSLSTLGGVQVGRTDKGNWKYADEDEIRVLEVPLSFKPHTFKKDKATEAEMVDWVKNSPLNHHFKEVKVRQPDRPPLPLDKGHLGLMLASGKLNGVVEGPHGCHVVRGSSHKVQYHNVEASTSEMNPETGAVTTKDVLSEKPVTVIRCVDDRGIIWTHSNNPAEAMEADEAREFDDI
jgi:hypothetical protein